jgi:hypothetical protein
LDYGNAIVLSRGTESPNQVSTEQNLITALMMRPDFAEDLYVAFPYFSLLSTTSAFQMMSPEYTHDNHKSYFVLGRGDNPLTYLSTVSGTGANNTSFVIRCAEGYGQPNQTLRTTDGLILQIQASPVASSGGYDYTVKFVAPGLTWDSGDYASGDKFGVGAQIYGEGSVRAYGTIQYPDLITNYTTITRYDRTVTGSAAASGTWLGIGDARFYVGTDSQWFYNNFMRSDSGFLYEKEKLFWDGVSNILNGQAISTDPQTGNPMYTGNGFEQQISNTTTATYSISDFVESWIQDQLAKFVYNAGLASCSVDVHTGSGGYSLFQKAMKNYIHSQLRLNTEANSARIVMVGADITEYFINDCRIKVYKNPVLSDPNYNTKLDGQTGFPTRSFNFYGIVRDTDDGIPTVQRVVRNFNGVNRSMVMSEEPGIMTKNGISSNGYDGKTFHFLSEDMIILRKPNRVFRWIRSV